METTKSLSFKSILLIIVLAVIYSLVGNMSFKIFSKQLLWISENTHTLIQGTLVVNLIAIVVFGLVIFKFLKLKLSDLYLSKKALVDGVISTLILWILVQITILTFNLITSEAITWSSFTYTKIGSLIAQLFGNALYEEFIFRAFLIVQLFVFFKEKLSNTKALIIAIILSQLVFALVHIPNRFLIESNQNLIVDLLQLFMGGIIGALIFIKTKNLIYLSGFHALTNMPFNIFDTSISSELLTLLFGILIAIFWKYLILKNRVLC